jgi:hypothetical protein
LLHTPVRKYEHDRGVLSTDAAGLNLLKFKDVVPDQELYILFLLNVLCVVMRFAAMHALSVCAVCYVCACLEVSCFLSIGYIFIAAVWRILRKE